MPRLTLFALALSLAAFTPPSPAADPPAKPHVCGRVLVVAVGVNDYPKLDGTDNLRFAENDAAEFGRLMADRYGYEVRLLLGSKGDGTRRKIERALKDAERELGEDDALIVYFSGTGRWCRCPAAGRPASSSRPTPSWTSSPPRTRRPGPTSAWTCSS